MGERLQASDFGPGDYRRFRERLDDCLQALSALTRRPDFDQGPAALGAELEMYIMDNEGAPLSVNREIQKLADDPLLTLELNRFNLEYNLDPVPLAERPFLTTEQRLQHHLEQLDTLAAQFGGRIVPVGILPTLQFGHFGAQAMTDEPRYHALKQTLTASRGSPFKTSITGKDELFISTEDITFEGANTSFQLHYKVSPENYADSYNTTQLITPLLVAAGANSPTAFGQRLWHETRIPLFKKSIDDRKEVLLDGYHWRQPPRVNFGNGWLRHGAVELFSESVQLYPVLLPVMSDEDPLAVTAAGGVPHLKELRLHQGTVWLWNRPVYDPAGGGHLRIELRAFPSGPTPIDMLANAALAIGLIEGLKPRINSLLSAIPFHIANHNFYAAAREGLFARLVWPDPQGSSMSDSDVCELILSLLPTADDGLASIGIDSEERTRYLDVIEQRVASRINGASWQLDTYEKLRREHSDRGAMRLMLEHYYEHACSNTPVHRWSL